MKRLSMFIAISLMFIGFNSCQKDEVASTTDEITLSQQTTKGQRSITGDFGRKADAFPPRTEIEVDMVDFPSSYRLPSMGRAV